MRGIGLIAGTALLGLLLINQANAKCNADYRRLRGGMADAVDNVLGQNPGDADLRSMRCIKLATGLREKSLPITETTLGGVSLIAALVDRPADQKRASPAEGYWDRELAAVIHQEQSVTVDLSLFAPLMAERLRLNCSALVISPEGKKTALLKNKKCFNAVPHGVAGQYEPTGLKLNFKHNGADDAEGRWTLILTVQNVDSAEKADLRLPYNFRIVYAE